VFLLPNSFPLNSQRDFLPHLLAHPFIPNSIGWRRRRPFSCPLKKHLNIIIVLVSMFPLKDPNKRAIQVQGINVFFFVKNP
jgi:hypothetical protein